MSTSPHQHSKGCEMCKPHKLRSGNSRGGATGRDPFRVLRRLGRSRRAKRHDLPNE